MRRSLWMGRAQRQDKTTNRSRCIVTSARDGSYWRASVQYAINFGMDEKRILDEEYLRAIELVEALPENQSGADKTWVPLHAGGIR